MYVAMSNESQGSLTWPQVGDVDVDIIYGWWKGIIWCGGYYVWGGGGYYDLRFVWRVSVIEHCLWK